MTVSSRQRPSSIYGRYHLDLLLNALYHLSRFTDGVEDLNGGLTADFDATSPSRTTLQSTRVNRLRHRMRRLTSVSCRTLNFARATLIALVFAQSNVADATNVPSGPGGLPQVSTQFEDFIQTHCVPCVREFYTIATVPFPSVKTPTFAG